MKKTILIAALALASAAASAQGLSGTVKYDYDRFESVVPALSAHRVTTGLKYDFGAVGAVDGGFVAGQLVAGGSRVNATGFDVGYSNGFSLGPVALTGRVGYSELNAGRIKDLTARVKTWSLGATAAYKLTQSVALVGGFEHLNAKLDGSLGGDAIANRYTVGADFAIAKNTTVRAVYARTRAEGENANGLTAAVTYKF